MKMRLILLAGTALTVAVAPASARERVLRNPAAFVLAQSDQPCPEGQDCQPAGNGDGQAAQPDQPPPPAADQQPAAEQPAPEPAPEQPAQADQPPPEQPAAEQPAAEQPEQQAEPAQPPSPEETVDRARKRKKQLQEQGQGDQQPMEPPSDVQPPAQAEQPQAEPAQQDAGQDQPRKRRKRQSDQAEGQPPAEGGQPPAQAEQPQTEPTQQDAGQDQPRKRRKHQGDQAEGQPPAEGGQAQGGQAQGGDAEPIQPPPQAADVSGDAQPQEDQSTVEQQLEAQGDGEQAHRVRKLRDQLMDQLQQVIGGPPPSDQDASGGRPRRDHADEGGRRHRRDRDYWDHAEEEGNVVERRGNRVIIDLGNGQLSVQPTVPDEGERLLYGARDVEVQDLPHGQTRTIVYRDNGTQIVTVRDRYGDIVSRTKVLRNGREIVLFDNRFDERDDNRRGPPPVLVDVPPPRVTIPRDRYIVDLGRASDDQIRSTLLAPPVQRVQRAYTLDEVLNNQQVRAYSPRIDLDTITFDFGSATIGNDQMSSLLRLGDVMEQVIADNPDEVYLIEGHTDAVGSDKDNLILSDRRAEAVATALSQNFDIPPENLVTQGYGEEYLKVDTQGPERKNRRATIRRLTQLLSARQ